VNRPLTCRPPGTGSHYLSVAEIVSLLEAVKDSRYAPLLRLLASTGLRRGETLALLGRRPDKRPSAGPWHALTGQRAPGVISEPKTERSRRDVPLSPATVALLRSVKASQAVERLKAASIWVETGLVFTTESGTAVDMKKRTAGECVPSCTRCYILVFRQERGRPEFLRNGL